MATLLDTLAKQAFHEAEAQAARVRKMTGLDLLAHGDPLAKYVTRRLGDGAVAQAIASEVGYRDPARVARVLAKSGHAPLARRLMTRHMFDRTVVR